MKHLGSRPCSGRCHSLFHCCQAVDKHVRVIGDWPEVHVNTGNYMVVKRNLFVFVLLYFLKNNLNALNFLLCPNSI